MSYYDEYEEYDPEIRTQHFELTADIELGFPVDYKELCQFLQDEFEEENCQEVTFELNEKGTITVNVYGKHDYEVSYEPYYDEFTERFDGYIDGDEFEENVYNAVAKVLENHGLYDSIPSLYEWMETKENYCFDTDEEYADRDNTIKRQLYEEEQRKIKQEEQHYIYTRQLFPAAYPHGLEKHELSVRNGTEYFDIEEDLRFVSHSYSENYTMRCFVPAENLAFAGTVTRETAEELLAHKDDPQNAFGGEGLRGAMKLNRTTLKVLDGFKNTQEAEKALLDTHEIARYISETDPQNYAQIMPFIKETAIKRLVGICVQNPSLDFGEIKQQILEGQTPLSVMGTVNSVKYEIEQSKRKETEREYNDFICKEFAKEENVLIWDSEKSNIPFNELCNKLHIANISAVQVFSAQHSSQYVKEDDKSYTSYNYDYRTNTFSSFGEFLKEQYAEEGSDKPKINISIYLNKEGNLIVDERFPTCDYDYDYPYDEKTLFSSIVVKGGDGSLYGQKLSYQTFGKTDKYFREFFESTSKFDAVKIYDVVTKLEETYSEKNKEQIKEER